MLLWIIPLAYSFFWNGSLSYDLLQAHEILSHYILNIRLVKTLIFPSQCSEISSLIKSFERLCATLKITFPVFLETIEIIGGLFFS